MSRGIVGVLPALGSGLTDLARSGQAERLLAYDLTHYARVFDQVRYFSYFDERLESFTTDPLLRERVRLYPRAGRLPPRAYTLMLPALHRRALRECAVLRVEQFTGVVPALLARWWWGVPYVVTYGYDYDTVARVAGSAAKPLYLEALRRLALPRAAAVIVPGADLAGWLRRRWPRARIVELPNGVDPVRFRPRQGPRADGAGRVVAYAGRLSAEKNLVRVIDALARLGEPGLRLRLIGDGPEAAALAARAARQGVTVEALGVVPNGRVPALLAGADCFVLPSLTEGSPKALLEAMACGLPCVVSDRGGNVTIVEAEATGLVCDPEDVGSIAAQLRRALSDEPLAERLGRAARDTVLRRYDVNRLMAEEVRLVAGVTGR